jgi:hypothetical protein
MTMDGNNKIEILTLYDNPDGDIYPEKDLPENARLLRGFVWRGDERIKTKDDIFPPDEVEIHNAIVLRSKGKYEKESAELKQNEELLITQINNAEKIKRISSLPKEDKTMGNIDEIINEKESFKIRGWAAIRDQNANDSKIRVVLIGSKDKFSISSEKQTRNDVTIYNKFKYNYDDSGFIVDIKKTDIPAGNYNIAIIIKNSHNREFVFKTTKVINNKN